MPVRPESTPNPNALKFAVGQPVGGPKTFAVGQETDDPVASPLLAIPGVTSVFMTADFVTLTKGPDGDWGLIGPEAARILEAAFDA